MDLRKNSLRRFSVPAAGTVNTDLTQTEPPVDPRFSGEPAEYPPDAASGITITGPSTEAKIAVRHQAELAETVPPAPQQPFPLTIHGRKRR
jgi:hypothetical protein